MDARNEVAAVAGHHGREITVRGIVLGAAITIAFMAANIYMGLKTGMTFSSSIPAALLSMGALRLAGGGHPREQYRPDPGLGRRDPLQRHPRPAGPRPHRDVAGLPLLGDEPRLPRGRLARRGLLDSLRRALVSGSALPYPEGVAAAEVLRAGHTEEGRGGLATLLTAAAGSGVVAFLTGGLRVLSEGVLGAFAVGGAAFSVGSGFSLALVGVGYLVGIGACLALLSGVVIAWGLLVPCSPPSPPPACRGGRRRRPFGPGRCGWWAPASSPSAGSGRWRPWRGHLRKHHRRRRGRPPPHTGPAAPGARPADPLGRDRRPGARRAAGGPVLSFSLSAGLSPSAAAAVTAAGTLFCFVFGAAMAAVCGYLAGLLGSSTSPISGIGILAAMVGALAVPAVLGVRADPELQRFGMAAVLLAASVVVTASSIANDNLQDLKTGQIVDATPWRQQACCCSGWPWAPW